MKRFFVGQSRSKKRVFRTADVALYRALSGDRGLAYAQGSVGVDSVPGPMLGGLVSDLLGTELPGKGTNWLKQRYDYIRPAMIDQKIEAAVIIARLRPEKGLVNLDITICGPAGEILCTGESLVLFKETQSA